MTAYNDAAGRAVTANLSADIVGRTLVPGVYKRTGALQNSGRLTLNALGNPRSVWIFQISSALNTASFSTVNLINGAQACNVYWQVGSSATLGTSSHFVGTIMALTAISVTTGATVEGRALARNAAVTLDNNVFTTPGCNTSPPTSPVSTPVTTPVTTPATTPVTTPVTTPGGPSGSVTPRASGPVVSNSASAGGVVVPRVVAASTSPSNASSTSQVALTAQQVSLARTGLPVVLMQLLGWGLVLAVVGGGLIVGGGQFRTKHSGRH